MKFAFILLSLVFLAACQKSNEKPISSDEAVYDLISQNHKQRQDFLSQGMSLKTDTSIEINDTSLSFMDQLCEVISSPQKALDYVASSANGQGLVRYLSQWAQQGECADLKVNVKDYPFEFAELRMGSTSVIAQATYNKDLKIINFAMLPQDQPTEIRKVEVGTRDGETLTTYILKPESLEKGPVLFQRTPYMSYGGFIMESIVALRSGMIYVAQANRGTHTSTGKFKWLDPMSNANDGEDTLEWLKKQDFSTGKFVAYGVSYDGFNALATSLNKPEGLTAVVACSAPAHAATDSFTSGKFVEAALLPYISPVGRKMVFRDGINPMMYALQPEVYKGALDRLKLDELIVGEDLEEWNLTSEAIDDVNHPYWEERSLYKGLEDIEIPIVHIAGLRRDQDGRDTVLAYKYLEKNHNKKKNNFLVMHPGGHGCGEVYQQSIFSKALFTSQPFSSKEILEEPQARLFKSTGYVSLDTYEQPSLDVNLERRVFLMDPLFSSEEEASDAEKLSENVVVHTALSSTVLNGMPELNLVYRSDVPEMSVHITLAVLDFTGQAKEVLFRSSFIAQQSEENQEAKVTMPPMLTQLNAGDRVMLYFSSLNPRAFYRYPEARAHVEAVETGKLGLELFQDSSIQLPVEADFEPAVAL